MSKDLKNRCLGIALAMVVALGLSGTTLAGQDPIPADETGPFAPEQLRDLVSGRVQITERLAGKWRGSLMIRRYSDDGRWTGCLFDHKGKIWDHGKTREWSVSADHRGRGRLFAIRSDRPRPIGPFVIHYNPDTGHLKWRWKPPKSGRWVDWNGGWFQEKWPQSAADKCPDLDLDGLEVDARQTGTTLEALREQTPDAPLKGLAEPLPGSHVYECEHRQKKSGPAQPCPAGKGFITTWQVYGGHCADWTTKTLWSGGPLLREEVDDSACGVEQ